MCKNLVWNLHFLILLVSALFMYNTHSVLGG